MYIHSLSKAIRLDFVYLIVEHVIFPKVETELVSFVFIVE